MLSVPRLAASVSLSLVADAYASAALWKEDHFMPTGDSSLVRSIEQATEIYCDGTYLTSNPTWHVEDSPWKAAQIRKIFEKNTLEPHSICEIGCGAGEVLRELSLRMPQAECIGYEVSAQAFAICETKSTARLKYVYGNVLHEDVYFDALLAIDVFEHVEDYIGFVKSIKSKAKYKVFHVPLDISIAGILRNTPTERRKLVGHLHYFTKETALATLVDCGYEIIDHSYTRTFDLTAKSVKARIARFPRRLLYSLSPGFLATTLGGCSLLVLTK